MATSSITREFIFETQEEVDALFDAIERSAKAQGIDLDADPDMKCPSKWTCSGCKYWSDPNCELLGGSSYWYGFCDGYTENNCRK